jgi:phospholipase D1/2
VAPRRVWSVLRLAALPLIFAIGALIAWKLGYFQLDRRQELAATVYRVRDLPLSAVWFVAGYVLAIVMVLPASMASLVGGAVFGAWKGALLAWGGAVMSTGVTHLLAHHVARAPAKRLFGEHRLLRELRNHDTVLALLRLRILPVAPFAVLDYVAGVANVSLPRLLAATALGVIPSVVAYSYVGNELMASVIAGRAASHRALWIAGGVTLGMLLLSAGPRLIKRFRA